MTDAAAALLRGVYNNGPNVDDDDDDDDDDDAPFHPPVNNRSFGTVKGMRLQRNSTGNAIPGQTTKTPLTMSATNIYRPFISACDDEC